MSEMKAVGESLLAYLQSLPMELRQEVLRAMGGEAAPAPEPAPVVTNPAQIWPADPPAAPAASAAAEATETAAQVAAAPSGMGEFFRARLDRLESFLARHFPSDWTP